MHASTLLPLLVAVATATLIRAVGCPLPTVDGWVAEYDAPEGSQDTYCYWSQCSELAGIVAWSPTYYQCVPNDKCLAGRARWCVDQRGGHYEGTKKNIFGKKREVSAKGEGKKWVA